MPAPPLWLTLLILTIAWAWAAVIVHGPWLLLYPAAWLVVGLFLLIVSKLADAASGPSQATQRSADPVAPRATETTSSV